MGVHEVIRPRNEAISLYTPPAPTSFASVVEAWTTEQLIQWMQGIDDAILPYLDCFAKNKVDGRSVFLLDDADLMNIGIDCFGVRAIITQAIQLLHHFCYELATENVQSLCLNVMVSARELVNEVQTAEWRSARAPSRAHLTAIHSAVYLAVSNVNEALKKLFHWLERRPLERHTSYKNMKDDLRLMQIDLLHSTKAQSKKMRLSFSLLIKNANRIIEKCDDILKNGSDHLLIQVSYLERAVLRKSKASSEWGIILQSSYQGVHEINELRSHSPADACEKIDVGDEIIQINGETVVGWDLGKVAQKISTCDQMKETSIYELVLLLKKMPADSDGSYSFHRFHSGQPYQLRSKRRRTGLLELSPSVRELFSPFYSKTPSCSIKQKRRSSSLPFLKQNSHLTVSNSQASISYLSENPSVISQFNSQVSSRRASVPCTSLNRDELSLSSGMLLNVELPLKQSPNREENTNLEPRKDRDQIDSNISFEPDEYAVIDLLDEAELCSVDSSSLERSGEPVSTYSIQQRKSYRRENPSSTMTKSTDCCGFADSSFSTDVQILDSEGSLPDEDVMISRFGTPSRKLNFIIGEEGCSSLSLRELLQIPCSQLDGKQYEGWIRRKRLSNESGFKRKWIKCWMALRSGLLHIYKEPSAPSADFVISIVKFVISDATDLKTSKKYVFRLSYNSLVFYFAAANSETMNLWMNRIALACQTDEERKTAESVNRVLSLSRMSMNDNENM